MTLEEYVIEDCKGERLRSKWAIRRDGSDKPGQIGRKVMVVKPKTTDETIDSRENRGNQ